jgi:hypothetical protein
MKTLQLWTQRVFLTALFVVGIIPLAYSQNIEDRVDRLLSQAVDDYDMLQIQDAEAKLQTALSAADEVGLESPVVAKAYVMLGIVQFAESRDENQARDAFARAVEIDPSVEIDPVYQTPTLQKLFDEVRGRAGSRPKPTPPEKRPKNIDSFSHKRIQTADAGQPLAFEAYVPADMPVYRMHVFHRRFDEDTFKKTEMLPTDDTRFGVELKGREIRTSQIDYYIVATDRGGQTLAQSGDEVRPNEIVVLGSTTVTPAPDDDDDDDDDDSGDDDDSDDDVDDDTSVAHDKNVFVSLSAGTDVGFVPGGTPTANPNRAVSPGLAPAFGHALLDFGVVLSAITELGLFFRFQFAPGQDFANLPPESINPGSGFWDTKEECLGLGLPGDCILGLKYRWYFSNTDSLRFHSSIGMGVGRIRNWLRLKQKTSETAPDPLCVGKEILSDSVAGNYCFIRDTVRTGWFHFGLGAGAAFPITDVVALGVDSYLMLLLPETSVNLDLTGALILHF